MRGPRDASPAVPWLRHAALRGRQISAAAEPPPPTAAAHHTSLPAPTHTPPGPASQDSHLLVKEPEPEPSARPGSPATRELAFQSLSTTLTPPDSHSPGPITPQQE